MISAVYDVDVHYGDPVIIFAPTFYRENRLGLVLNPCKDVEGAIHVRLFDPSAPIKEICVGADSRDTLERLQSNNNA